MVAGLLTKGVIKGVLGIIDKVVPDANLRDKIKQAVFDNEHELKTLAIKAEAEAKQGQLDINREEAKHSSVFVAGWRPFIGWICGFIFLYTYILRDFLVLAADRFGLDSSLLVSPDWSVILMVLGGMLGLGGLRTSEKVKGVARSGIKGN